MVCKPLQTPYEGPFPVLKRHDKYFTVNVKGKNMNISLDRLKAAFILNNPYPFDIGNNKSFKGQTLETTVNESPDHSTSTESTPRPSTDTPSLSYSAEKPLVKEPVGILFGSSNEPKIITSRYARKVRFCLNRKREIMWRTFSHIQTCNATKRKQYSILWQLY